jgi:hypothetical protein
MPHIDILVIKYACDSGEFSQLCRIGWILWKNDSLVKILELHILKAMSSYEILSNC